MQTSGSGHASRASEPTAGLAAFCTGSVGLAAANSTGGVAGCGIGIGGGSDKAAVPLAISATETPCSLRAVVRSASTCSPRAVADVARLTSIGGPALLMPSEPGPTSPAPTQPARATVPHNAANTASRRGLFTPVPLKFLPRNDGGFQSSVDDDCKPYRAATEHLLGTRAHECPLNEIRRRAVAAFAGALDPFFVVGRLLLYLPKSPREKRSGNLCSCNLAALVREEDTDDFDAVDGCRNGCRDGDRLHTWPDLANPV
jgi:hypothetical protein